MLNLLTGLVRRTRQHHAIEHAALQLLAPRVPGRRLVGLSDPYGFTVFGNVQQAQVQRAVSDAMLRLQAGEAQLAIHPHCGTNLAVTGLLAAGAASLARVGKKRNPVETLMRSVFFVIPALVASEPLGLELQRYTTLAEIGDRWMVGVRTARLGPLTVNRVVME
jgi:hypothetical protein